MAGACEVVALEHQLMASYVSCRRPQRPAANAAVAAPAAVAPGLAGQRPRAAARALADDGVPPPNRQPVPSRPVRSRTQETQPAAPEYAQQPRRFTSGVPDGRQFDVPSATAAAPAYRLVMNPVWQPQAAADPVPAQMEQYIQPGWQQQHEQPGEACWAADAPQQSGKRPRLTVELSPSRATNADPAAAVQPPLPNLAQPEQQRQPRDQRQQLQQQQQPAHTQPTAAMSRFAQLCQLAEQSLDEAVSPPPVFAAQQPAPATNEAAQPASLAEQALQPERGANSFGDALAWQPETVDGRSPAAEAEAPEPAAQSSSRRHSRLTAEVQDAVAASADRVAKASR